MNNPDLDKLIKKVIFQDCNNKINEFNDICNYLTQYSQANIFIIPKKYKTTIKNELDDVINKYHIPVAYEIKEDAENTITLILFNFGVMQRETFIEGMKNEGDNH